VLIISWAFMVAFSVCFTGDGWDWAFFVVGVVYVDWGGGVACGLRGWNWVVEL